MKIERLQFALTSLHNLQKKKQTNNNNNNNNNNNKRPTEIIKANKKILM